MFTAYLSHLQDMAQAHLAYLKTVCKQPLSLFPVHNIRDTTRSDFYSYNIYLTRLFRGLHEFATTAGMPVSVFLYLIAEPAQELNVINIDKEMFSNLHH